MCRPNGASIYCSTIPCPSLDASLATHKIRANFPISFLVVLIVFAPLLIVLGSAMGVLYAGAIDPALALRRGTVYGAIGALGVVIFAGLENALSSFVEPRLGLPSFVGPLVAGAIGAAVLIPIQRRVSRAVGQRLGKLEANRPSSPDTAPVASRIS